MSTPPSFDTLRSDIAGMSVRKLAEEFGTPAFVYDAAQIVERVNDLKAFDVIRYAQKACSNLAILDLVRRHGVLVDAVSAGEIGRALAAGYTPQGDPPPIVYTADIFDSESLDLVLRHGIHVNCGSPDMIDQIGERARAATLPCGSIRASATATARKPTPAANNRSTASGTNNWPTACAGPIITGWESAACTCTSARAPTWSTWARSAARWNVRLARSAARSRRSAPAAVCRFPIAKGRPMSTWTPTSSSGTPPGGGWKTPSATSCVWKSNRAVTWSPRAAIWSPGFVRSNKWVRTLFTWSTRASTTWPGPSCTAPIIRCRSSPWVRVQRKSRDVVVGGPLCESGDIFTQEEGGFVATRSLPAAAIGELLVIERAGAYGFVMGSNYNSKPLAAEVLIDRGQAHLVRRRQTFDDIIAGEIIPNV